METSEQSKNLIYKEVKNNAHLWEEEQPKPVGEDINKQLSSFWNDNLLENCLNYYKDGYLRGQLATGKTGQDGLKNVIITYVAVIKRFMRESGSQLSGADMKVFNMLEAIAEILNESTIDTVSIKDNKITNENIVAYFQGFLTAQYEKIKEIHE